MSDELQIEAEAAATQAELAEAATANEEPTPESAKGEDLEQPPEPAPADDDAGAPQHKKGAEKRIGQLTRKFRQEQRVNKELKARLEALEQRIGPAPEPERPRREGFNTTEDYEDALLDWRDATREKVDTTQQAEDLVRDLSEEQSQTIETFENELDELAPDAALIVLDDDWPCSPPMTEFIMDSDRRAELAYHLATNPDVAARIEKMTPVKIARELIKIEGELPDKQKPSADAATNAPPPPMTTGRPRGGAATVDPNKQSTDEWVEQRRREMAANAR